MQAHGQVKFVYQGHQFKVKVTGAKRVCVCCSKVTCLRLKRNLVMSASETQTPVVTADIILILT